MPLSEQQVDKFIKLLWSKMKLSIKTCYNFWRAKNLNLLLPKYFMSWHYLARGVRKLTILKSSYFFVLVLCLFHIGIWYNHLSLKILMPSNRFVKLFRVLLCSKNFLIFQRNPKNYIFSVLTVWFKFSLPLCLCLNYIKQVSIICALLLKISFSCLFLSQGTKFIRLIFYILHKWFFNSDDCHSENHWLRLFKHLKEFLPPGLKFKKPASASRYCIVQCKYCLYFRFG